MRIRHISGKWQNDKALYRQAIENMDKKHIIQEIVKKAKKNNDMALGMNRFEKETGIKPTELIYF